MIDYLVPVSLQENRYFLMVCWGITLLLFVSSFIRFLGAATLLLSRPKVPIPEIRSAKIKPPQTRSHLFGVALFQLVVCSLLVTIVHDLAESIDRYW